MANINSISSNSYSSGTNLYGNRNVLTGLASGMDTETMIQNSVSGYQTKITELQQSTTKLEWKQDAYRELIDQMYNINQKYMSYTSKTNLSSNAFFTNAVTTTTQGSNADAISATGTAKSDIQINAVQQLATAARYSVDAGALSVEASQSLSGGAIDWSQQGKVGQIKGTLTLKYGSQSIDLKFDESDSDIDSAAKLKEAIEEKLADVSLNTKKGSVKASELIKVNTEGGKFTFEVDRSNKNDDGSSVYINTFTGNLATTLGATRPVSTSIEDKVKNNSLSVDSFKDLVKEPNMAEYLSGKTVDVTLDGTSKQVKIGDLAGMKITIDGEEKTLGTLTSAQLKEHADEIGEKLKEDLQASIDKQFGKGKVTVNIKNGGLDFGVAEGSGSTLKVTSEAGEKLGIGKSGVSNFFNTSKTLEDLLSTKELNAARVKAADGKISEDVKYYDEEGNRVKQEGLKYFLVDDKGEFIKKNGSYVMATSRVNALHTDSEGNLVRRNYDDDSYYRVNEKGEFLYGLTINGTTIDGITKDSTLESIINKINSNADVGVTVSYSDLTSQFVFTARETGEGGDISFDDALARKLFTPDNSPQNMKLDKFFGDNIKWNEDGTARIQSMGTITGLRDLQLSKGMTVRELIDKIESQSEAYKGLFSYDESTGSYSLVDGAGNKLSDEIADQFVFYDPNTKKAVEFNKVLGNIKGAEKTKGTDAVIDATVNGKQLTLKRSSNVVNMDGLSLTLKEEFSAYDEKTGKLSKADAVTFKTNSNADDIVKTVKEFVDDVNKLMTDVHDAFATQPAEKSATKHTRYEPLTEDDKKDMSESAISAYEEKAKQGLLFGDTDLSNLYSRLLNAVQSFGGDRVDMESIGLSTTFSGGVTTVSFDESKMRSALESNPDKVRSIFTKTTEGGSASNGLMANLKTTLNAYASTSLGSPGLLVSKAGTKFSSLSLLNNNLQKQIDNVNNQIESWQTKLSSKIDYYTKQFTQLEKLMSTMNNQSSMLADLMGY